MADTVEFDLSDVEPRVGKLVGGGQMWEPCSATDIRRWVMALDYPSPIHWNEEFARGSRFGGIVAPQSFAVAMDYAHGVQPACVGRIPGSHLIFGGEEWWFYGTPIRPGDRLVQERRFHGYKVTDTKFAGPTMFSHGDTIHTNQHGALVAKERATAIRYLAAEAEKRGMYDNQDKPIRRWSSEELAALDRARVAWIQSNREGTSPLFADVKVGTKLPRRVMGPHTIASFTTEYRAFIQDTWGTYRWTVPEGVADPWLNQDSGWIEGFAYDLDGATIDPRKRDGLYGGPSRAHVDTDKAGQIGMFRAYGYGATMGGWMTDTLAYWAGHRGMVRHIKSNFRGPAFEGDATFIDAEVVDKQEESGWGVPLVTIKARATTQDGEVLVDSVAEVEVPLLAPSGSVDTDWRGNPL
ncbi:MaoC family dehydratase N-terminal domain-containing protein [Sphingomonas tabacisoli]|uniref:MaoC family dehydratase N-terminal domain-containing protein n=1 Tax=Sphingomonas tabacisoli TaxID=2249466 RepID=A0ABW4I2S8_9SPHN